MSDEYRPMTITVDVDDNVYGRFYVYELDKWNYEDSVPREVHGAEVWVQYRIETCYNLFEGVENPIEEMERLREIEREYHALVEAVRRTEAIQIDPEASRNDLNVDTYPLHDAGYDSLPFWWRMDDYNLKPDDERDE